MNIEIDKTANNGTLSPSPEIHKKMEFSKEVQERVLRATAGVALKGKEKHIDIVKWASLPQDYQDFEIAKTSFVTQDPKMKTMLQDAITLSESKCSVLIRGETGTGKELIARILHGKRPKDSFVTINCTALPGELFESILFGHKKGAFTGAHADNIGLIAQANGGGTVFLDEIGDLPMLQQAKLLRVIEYGEYYQVGNSVKHYASCRWISATNKDVERMSRDNPPTFRNDLYWRIRDVVLRTSPLAERKGDIRLIANKMCVDNDWSILTDDELEQITYQSGNVREMRSYIIHLEELGYPPPMEL